MGLLFTMLSTLSAAETKQHYVYGPFESLPSKITGANGRADYWIPGQLVIDNTSAKPEFRITKFILHQSADASVPGLANGRITMGGILSFKVIPGNAPASTDALNRRATTVWKAASIQLPGNFGFSNTLSDAGSFGAGWTVNLMLRRDELDALWQPGREEHGTHLVPKIRVSIAYRTYVEGENSRLSVSLEKSAFMEAFHSMMPSSPAGAGHGLPISRIEKLMRTIESSGSLATSNTQGVSRFSKNQLMAIFTLARINWLEYALDPDTGHNNVILVRPSENADQTPNSLSIDLQGWLAMEQLRTLDVAIQSGSWQVNEIMHTSFVRESELTLMFIPWEDWQSCNLEQVIIAYQVTGNRDVEFDRGTVVLDITTNHIVNRSVQSMDDSSTRIRSKLLGYRQGQKFVSLPDAPWKVEQASLRRHLRFVTPDDVTTATDTPPCQFQ